MYKYQADCSGNIKSGWGTCPPVAPSLRPPLCTISWIVSHRPFNHPSTSIRPSPSLSLYFLCLLVFFIISFVILFFSFQVYFDSSKTPLTHHRPPAIDQVDHLPPALTKSTIGHQYHIPLLCHMVSEAKDSGIWLTLSLLPSFAFAFILKTYKNLAAFVLVYLKLKTREKGKVRQVIFVLGHRKLNKRSIACLH